MFLDEITKNLGLSGTNKNNFSILNYGANGVYIQGKLFITQISSVKICVNICGRNYMVTGENLTILRLNKDSLYINGEIFDILKN